MAGYFIIAGIMLPWQLICWVVAKPLTRINPQVYFRMHRAVAGPRVTRFGSPRAGNRRDGGTLIVSNHTSHFDPEVIGCDIPCVFIAKAEVAEWPIFGWLARAAGCVFIDRTRRSGTGKESRAIAARLAEGDNVVLFPEGTTSDGRRLLPFKSALFAAAQPVEEGQEIWVQPTTITYRAVGGLPLTRDLRAKVAWYGDMPFISHKFIAYGLHPIDATVRFHEPVRLSDFPSRKALANYCRAVIKRGHEHDLLFREGDPEPVEKAAFMAEADAPRLAAE